MHFGYNCTNYLPWFEKCSILIEKRKQQKELLDTKWLSIRDALIYSRLLKLDLWSLIEKEKVEVKKRGKSIRIGFEVAWQYDECPLAHSGGMCGYFKPHNDTKISCLAEINSINRTHPNTPEIPNSIEIKTFANEISIMVEQQSPKTNNGLLF